MTWEWQKDNESGEYVAFDPNGELWTIRKSIFGWRIDYPDEQRENKKTLKEAKEWVENYAYPDYHRMYLVHDLRVNNTPWKWVKEETFEYLAIDPTGGTWWIRRDVNSIRKWAIFDPAGEKCHPLHPSLAEAKQHAEHVEWPWYKENILDGD